MKKSNNIYSILITIQISHLQLITSILTCDTDRQRQKERFVDLFLLFKHLLPKERDIDDRVFLEPIVGST